MGVTILCRAYWKQLYKTKGWVFHTKTKKKEARLIYTYSETNIE